jgi:predicted hydrocarbon binding protein
MQMDVEAMLNLLARRQIDRFLGAKQEVRPKLGNRVDVFAFQERTLAALILSPSMGPVLFEVGRKLALEAAKRAVEAVSKLPDYHSFVGAKNLEEARLSTEFALLQLVFKSTGVGLLKLTHYEKDKQSVSEAEECAECFAFGDVGKTVCYYTGGILIGVLQAAFNRRVGFVESRCVAKGDPCCEFKCDLRMEADE